MTERLSRALSAKLADQISLILLADWPNCRMLRVVNRAASPFLSRFSVFPGQSYQDAHRQSIEDPVSFWSKQADSISWINTQGPVLKQTDGPSKFQWFAEREMNTCFNCVDVHVNAGLGKHPAIIYDSPITATIQTITYNQLLTQVQELACALRARGVKKGDRVIIYMPMIPQTVVAFLACARIGAVHACVFGGFAPNELAKRIVDAKPTMIIAASCGLEGPTKVIPYGPNLQEAAVIANQLNSDAVHPDPNFDAREIPCIMLQRPQCEATLGKNDVEWRSAIARLTPQQRASLHHCEPVKGSDPLYILYTSGTTGAPKGVLRENGGHAVALKFAMKSACAVNNRATSAQSPPVFWSSSDFGWAVGHSFIVYGPLLNGLTTVVYEGKPVGTPDAGAFWRVCDQHRVVGLYTAPTAIRAIRKEDPEGSLRKLYKMQNFQHMFLAGERADPNTVQWIQDKLGISVIDNWWQVCAQVGLVSIRELT